MQSSCHKCNAAYTGVMFKCPSCGVDLVKKQGSSSSAFFLVVGLIVAGLTAVSLFKSDKPTTKYDDSPVLLGDRASLGEEFVVDGYALLMGSVATIQNHGNVCSSVDNARKSIYDGSITITCNNNRYQYEIKDVGGKLEYKVIR